MTWPPLSPTSTDANVASAASRRSPLRRRAHEPAIPSARDGRAARARPGDAEIARRTRPGVADQPLLSQRSARELRQARAHADARAHEHRRRHTGALAGRVLGRESVAGAAAELT